MKDKNQVIELPTMGIKQVNLRNNFMNELKNKQKQTRSYNMTLDKVKETFQATDLNEQKKKDVIDEESDDSDYDPTKQQEQDNNPQIWDEEENFLDEKEEQAASAKAEEEGEVENTEEVSVTADQIADVISEVSEDPVRRKAKKRA